MRVVPLIFRSIAPFARHFDPKDLILALCAKLGPPCGFALRNIESDVKVHGSPWLGYGSGKPTPSCSRPMHIEGSGDARLFRVYTMGRDSRFTRTRSGGPGRAGSGLL
jgi:hypothetical protein